MLNSKHYFPAYYIKTGSLSQTRISAFQKDQNWSFFAQHSKSYSNLKVGAFFGTPCRKMLEIQVFVFNYRRISISQMFEKFRICKI